MSKPPPRYVVVNRGLAASLVLESGPATAKDLALWLAVMGPAMVPADDPEGYRDDLLDHRPPTVPVHALVGQLVEDVSVAKPCLLRRMAERLGESQFMLAGDDGMTPRQPLRRFATRAGMVPTLRSQVAVAEVDAPLLAAAVVTSDDDALAVDLAAMARFKSRYSAFLYLRCLAWLAGAEVADRSWRARPLGMGRVVLDVPVDSAGHALGALGYDKPSLVDQVLLCPRVHADLATAGISLATRWRRWGGMKGSPVASLELAVQRGSGARLAGRPVATARSHLRLVHTA